MNVEQAIIQGLAAAGFEAHANAPDPRPAAFVTVERTGGGVRDGVDSAVLAVQCWADRRKAAADMTDSVREALFGLQASGGLGGIRVTHVYNWPDIDSKMARYQMTVEVAAHA